MPQKSKHHMGHIGHPCTLPAIASGNSWFPEFHCRFEERQKLGLCPQTLATLFLKSAVKFRLRCKGKWWINSSFVGWVEERNPTKLQSLLWDNRWVSLHSTQPTFV
jgi:hypothetical protein